MGLLNPRPGGDGGGSAIEVIHSSGIANPIPKLYATAGEKQATAATDTAAVQALTAGVFTVDGVSTAAIDFSGVPDGIAGINPITALINAAIDNVAALDGYSTTIAFINPNFHFRVSNSNGNVGVLSGNVVTAMGLNAFTEQAHAPASGSLIIPPPASGYWRELRFRSLFQINDESFYCTSRSTFVSDGTNIQSWLSALSNNGNWFEHQSYNESNGLYAVCKATYYSQIYSDFLYNPTTGELTWDNQRNVSPNVGEVYRLVSLMVLGARGT